MEENKPQIVSIDAFIGQFPDDVREKLRDMRRIIRASAPGAAARMRY